jgi:hypothetical protein
MPPCISFVAGLFYMSLLQDAKIPNFHERESGIKFIASNMRRRR